MARLSFRPSSGSRPTFDSRLTTHDSRLRSPKSIKVWMCMGRYPSTVKLDVESTTHAEEESPMDTARFDAVLRSLSPGASRRGLLAALAGGLLVALPRALGVDEAEARKKRKRKKKKPLPPATPSPPPPRTCAQLCPMSVTTCLHRVEGAPLCSSDYGFDCTPCSSDQDCLGSPNEPYCITSSTDRATGISESIVGPGTSCPGLTVGTCTNVSPP